MRRGEFSLALREGSWLQERMAHNGPGSAAVLASEASTSESPCVARSSRCSGNDAARAAAACPCTTSHSRRRTSGGSALADVDDTNHVHASIPILASFLAAPESSAACRQQQTLAQQAPGVVSRAAQCHGLTYAAFRGLLGSSTVANDAAGERQCMLQRAGCCVRSLYGLRAHPSTPTFACEALGSHTVCTPVLSR